MICGAALVWACGATLAWTVGPRLLGGRISFPDRRERAAKRAPHTAIGDVAAGATVKLRGTVRLAGEGLDAPFTGRRCCCYTIEQIRRRTVDYGRESRGRAHDARNFFVEDETGRALVEVGPETRIVAEARSVGDSPDGFDLFEWALMEGSAVSVFGPARWERDPDPGDAARSAGYRDAPRLLVVGASVILEA